MKKSFKRNIPLIAALVACLVLIPTGCGGDKAADSYVSNSSSYKSSAEPAMYEYGYNTGDSYNDEGNYDIEYSPNPSNGTSTGKNNSDLYENDTADSSRKLIKRVSMHLETLEFDKSISMLEEYVRRYNGYIEASNVYYNERYTDYYKSSLSNRTAEYTVRIPNNLVDGFVSSAGDIGNIISNQTSTEDITLGYLDVESRAKALKIQQERLLALLEEATSVDEIIALEDRISQVTYELESKESTLRNYDSLVSFSTVNLSLTEVNKITEPEPETTGQRISSGLSDTFENIGNGFTNFFVEFVVNLPYIVIFLVFSGISALIAVIIVKICKRSSRKRAEKRKNAPNPPMNMYNNAPAGNYYNNPAPGSIMPENNPTPNSGNVMPENNPTPNSGNVMPENNPAPDSTPDNRR